MFNKNIYNEQESLIRKYTRLVKQYDDGISLAIGEPSIEVDEKIIAKAIKELENKSYKYTSAKGDDELVREICLKENVLESNVLVTYGSSEGIFICLLSILNPNEEVIIITPCYPQYAPVVSFCGGKPIFLDTSLTKFIPTKNSLIKCITDKTKAIIINSPSNPTGIMYDDDTIKMFEDISNEYNLFLLVDDVYEKLCYKDVKRSFITSDKKIILKSFSKTYGMTGFRLGYILASDYIINQILKVHSYLCISVPVFIQKSGVVALQLSDLDYSRLINNLEYIKNFCKENNLSFIDVSGGIFIFINIENICQNDIEFCDKLLENYHVACVPGICFKAPGYIRLNFAVEDNVLRESLNRIQCFIKQYI